MRERIHLQPVSIALGILGTLVLIALVAAANADTTEPPTTRAALDPSFIVNISGRRGSNTPPVTPIYTVPGGKTLIIRGFAVTGYNDFNGVAFEIGFNIKCGSTILVPREIVAYVGGYDPLELSDLGWTCGAGLPLTLTGPPVTASADSVGWTLMGELR